MRVITGDFKYHSNYNSAEIWMEKGKHQAVVQFRTNAKTINYSNLSDWTSAYFRIRYYDL